MDRMVKEETAAMDVKQEVADAAYEDEVFCCDDFAALPALQDVAGTDHLQGELGGMQAMLDDIYLWDADALFSDVDAAIENQGKMSLGDCRESADGDAKPSEEDIAVVFLEWLKANKGLISREDFRRIKLKKSTVESAAKRLGGGREGMKKLVKPVLKWVQDHYLPRKRNIVNHYVYRAAPAPTLVYANLVFSGSGERLVRVDPSAAAREARKKRMEIIKQVILHRRSRPQSETQQSPIIYGEPKSTPNIKNLKLLLRKVLRQSDINRNKIVLPKSKAETHLPELIASDGISIEFEDIGTSLLWNMRYRYWLNNRSRMYVLENTCDFLRANELQQGDFIVLYSDVARNRYLILGVKVVKAEMKPHRVIPSTDSAGADLLSAPLLTPS